MNLSSYVAALDTRYRSGIAREHSYRGDLQNLLQAAVPNVLVTNEPARVACGAPDYILTQKATGIDVGYIEAKDIGKSLDDKGYNEQFLTARLRTGGRWTGKGFSIPGGAGRRGWSARQGPGSPGRHALFEPSAT
jgi:hypothetical protein